MYTNMKIFKYIVIILPLIFGCGPATMLIGPAVTGVVYWVNGEAHKYYEETPEVLYRVTKHSLIELNIPITKDEPKDNSYYILAGKDNRFSINISPSEQNLSKVSLRINYLGDKDYAELIYKKIDEQISIIHFDDQGNPTKRKTRIYNK